MTKCCNHTSRWCFFYCCRLKSSVKPTASHWGIESGRRTWFRKQKSKPGSTQSRPEITSGDIWLLQAAAVLLHNRYQIIFSRICFISRSYRLCHYLAKSKMLELPGVSSLVTVIQKCNVLKKQSQDLQKKSYALDAEKQVTSKRSAQTSYVVYARSAVISNPPILRNYYFRYVANAVTWSINVRKDPLSSHQVNEKHYPILIFYFTTNLSEN